MIPWCASSSRFLLFSVLWLSPLGFSQNTPPPTPTGASGAASGSAAIPPSGQSARAATDLAQESVIFERNLLNVTFEPDGTGTRELELTVRIQSQAGVQALSVLTFPYLSSNENVEFDYVRVRKPDGTVVNTPDYNVQDMPAEVTRAAPMYSDLHEKHVTVKALGVGDVLEYKVRYRTFKPQVSGQFWWQQSFDKNFISPIIELQLTVPKDKYLNLSSPNYKPEIKEDGSHRTYIWKTSNLKRNDSNEPESREAPRPDIQLSTFRSWQEVGSWYNDLQRSQMQVTPQIQAKVVELTKGLTSQDDKIRVIYDYVSSGFHYVSLSFGAGRYQPHPAEDVLENQYGDCKDKHTLLATMLKAAGVEAWPALINAERKLDPDMPSPGQFDHVITYVPESDKTLWLDTTPGVAPFNMLMATLRDKQALVIPGDKPAALKTTPANPPFPADQTFTMEGAIDKDGTLKSHVKQTIRGDREVYLRLAFRATAQAQWKDLVQHISKAEGFGGETSNVSASSPEDTSKPIEFSYDYTRKNYSDWDNHRMLAPLPVFGLEGAAVQEKKPADPVALGGLGDLVYSANITLPVDVEGLQSDVSLKEAYADYESTYSHVGNVLMAKRRLKIKQNGVPIASWDNYKKFSKAISDDWGSYTELYAVSSKEKDASVVESDASAGSGMDDASVADAHERWRQAWNALDRGDTTSAEDILLEALKKYPTTRGLHATLGQVYGSRNDVARAISEFTKEEELHPEYPLVYATFGQYYETFLHRYANAEEQYRKWVEHDPTNYDAYAKLSGVLDHEKKYPALLELWEGAEKQLPDNKHVKKSLGYAYLFNKQPQKGAPLIEEGLDADSKPMEFNSAAYQFAEANVELPKAKEWGEKAISGLYKESLATETEEAALANTSGILATWDTLGWVYYKLGDYGKAAPYLSSAFTLSQSAVDGDHLAQTYQKLDKKRDAEHTYKLAFAQATSPLKEDIKGRYQLLMGKDADPEESPVLLKRGTTSNNFGAEDELSRARTTKISATAATTGSATFTIVFSPGKIEDVKFVNGEEKLKPMAIRIANSKLRAEFPDSTPARLTRRGVLVCGVTGCDFTLLLPNDAYNTENMPPSK
jgi:tetratricopeptide (TPR) repeat protein